MTPLELIAPAFVDMAHSIVWASVATVDRDARPRSRILHPIWEWDGIDLTGWIATHDTASVDCSAQWFFDDETRIAVWDKFKNGPVPVGYDPATIEPGTAMTAGVGDVLSWHG